MTDKPRLYGASLAELQRLCEQLELPRFASKQIARWLYTRFVTDIDAMTDLSKLSREKLKQTCDVGLTSPLKVSTSTDGTKKYLFRTSQGESALIPDGERMTLCVRRRRGVAWGVNSAPRGVWVSAIS